MTYSQFIDQLYIECVLEDDLDSLMQDQSSNAIQKLEDIRDQLTACVSSREELLDYYSQDKIFASIVGVSNRYNNLCNYIDKASKKEEESDEVFVTTGSLAVVAVAGLASGLISSLIFDRGITGAYTAASANSSRSFNFNTENYTSRYAVEYQKVEELCKDINECMSHLKQWAQYPHIFNKEELEQVSKKLHMQVPDIKTSEKIAAGSKAAIKGFINSASQGAISGLIYGVVYSLFNNPYAIGSGVTNAVGVTTGSLAHNVSAKYNEEINKTAKKTLAECGWTEDNFRAFSKELVVIIQNVRMIYKIIKDNKKYFKSKDDFKLCKSFYTLALMAVKGLCKMYISICYAAKTKKQHKGS